MIDAAVKGAKRRFIKAAGHMSDKDKNIRKADEIERAFGDYKKHGRKEREKTYGKIDLEKPEQKPIGKKPLHSSEATAKSNGEKDNAKKQKKQQKKKSK